MATVSAKQGRCCCRRHFPSHVAVNVEGVWGKASLPQRTPVKTKGHRDSGFDDERSVLRDVHSKFREIRSLGCDSVRGTWRDAPRGGRQRGSGRVFWVGLRFLFALQRHAFAICATTIRVSAQLSVRVQADGIRVCAICRSFSRAQCTQNVPRC